MNRTPRRNLTFGVFFKKANIKPVIFDTDGRRRLMVNGQDVFAAIDTWLQSLELLAERSFAFMHNHLVEIAYKRSIGIYGSKLVYIAPRLAAAVHDFTPTLLGINKITYTFFRPYAKLLVTVKVVKRDVHSARGRKTSEKFSYFLVIENLFQFQKGILKTTVRRRLNRGGAL